MKKVKQYLVSIIYVILGVVLIGLGFIEKLDSFWSGMGGAFFVIGVVRFLRTYRLNKNEEYREKVEIEENDERNRFIRNKAWAWAGYLFVMIVAVAAIVLKIMGQDMLSIAAGAAVCLVILLFWLSYFILRRKY